MKYKHFRLLVNFILALLSAIALRFSVARGTLIFDINSIETMFLWIILFYLYNKFYLSDKKKHTIFVVLSMLFSYFLLIGKIIDQEYSRELLLNNISAYSTVFIGYSIMWNYIFNKVYDALLKIKIKNFKISNKIVEAFDKHPILFPILMIVVCWLPYLIAFFPGIVTLDGEMQIKSMFGVETVLSNAVNLINPKVLITNHHPFLHTFILGSSVKIGHSLFNSTNIGIFIYVIIQMSIFVGALVYSLAYLKKNGTPYWILFTLLMFYSLCPFFPHYAIKTEKDVFFASFILMFLVTLYDCIKTKKITYKKLLLFSLSSLGIIMFRKNGIYVIIPSVLALVIFMKNYRFKIVCSYIVILLINLGFNNMLLPLLEIPKGSISEALSIPFQQTARYVKLNKKHITKKEYKVIDRTLDMTDLAERYIADVSDPVKAKYNKDLTKKELAEYFKIWLIGLKKDPLTYFEATIRNTYGYYYPSYSTLDMIDESPEALKDDKFNYYRYTPPVNEIYYGLNTVFWGLPFVGNTVDIAVAVWLYLFMISVIIVQKKYKYLIYFVPIIFLILSCLASPLNAYFNYAMSYVYALPFTMIIFINILKENEKKHNKNNTLLS